MQQLIRLLSLANKGAATRLNPLCPFARYEHALQCLTLRAGHLHEKRHREVTLHGRACRLASSVRAACPF